MDAIEQANNNPAVIKEIAKAQQIVDQHAKDVTAVSVSCNQVQGNDKGTWLYGVVRVHFLLKDNAALRKQLQAAGYHIEQRKRTEYAFYADEKEKTRVHAFAYKRVSLLD